jgi:hypothetical protein
MSGWEVQGLYVDERVANEDDWECLTHHDTETEALAEASVYDANERCPHRVRPACDSD